MRKGTGTDKKQGPDRQTDILAQSADSQLYRISLFRQNEKDFKDYLFGGVHFTCVNLRIQTRHRLFVEQTYHLDPKSILAKQNAETAEIVSDGGLSRQSVSRQTDKQATVVLQCTVGVVCKTDGRTDLCQYQIHQLEDGSTKLCLLQKSNLGRKFNF